MIVHFTNFNNVEANVAQFAPATVYKYRGWLNDFHKDVLRKRELYFSHPFGLNDPKDVRPDYRFDLTELEDPRYYEKLLASAAGANPHLHSAEELAEAAKAQWQYTKEHPHILSENQINWSKNERNFDNVGVFSTAMDPLLDEMWVQYGDNHAGYVAGFSTVELCRTIKSGYGYVTYSDEPHFHSFVHPQEDLDILYLKKTSWSHEKEFRFITVGVGIYCEQVQQFEINALSEVTLGYAISIDHEKDILNVIAKEYPKGQVQLYKTRKDSKGNLIREQIN